MLIRKATPDEAGNLSGLAFRSKAYWGYSDDFMEACRDDLTISPERIASSLIYVVEEDCRMKGFVGLEIENGECLLTDLFIEPDAIGKGYGRALLQYIIEKAKDLGIHAVTLHSDPHAENFYLRMGARRIGDIESTVFPGRKLPLLEIAIRS
ncbi:MAG: GNAT family N-acetyltransferase [Paenibacillus dendritiformis]|uniref:GNAT family N-acetyltransferase n=1 Tax=uncultured Paenibacillus sp. TaxID=227322 RepID=UPI0025FE3835|nr:GNAT family N-acetyltransferase [uncultured Paenibacillus sp.]MDU5144025.1 GNAT family N-acetyltransferase [Paenibacillus dendritiformis]